MKFLLLLIAVLCMQAAKAQSSDDSVSYASPLVDFSMEWEQEKYAACNTAADADYLSDNEKDIIYILNLARQYPVLFCKTVLLQYPEMYGKEGLLKDAYYFQSLVALLKQLPAQQALQPDKKCFESAACHAAYSGKTGYVGHSRLSKQCSQFAFLLAECCDYGDEDPLDIVVSLLIDKGVKSLTHRKILLGSYKSIGVSVQPHKKFRINTVIDLH